MVDYNPDITCPATPCEIAQSDQSLFLVASIFYDCFLALKEAADARLSLHLSKYHIVGNHLVAQLFNLPFPTGRF